MIRQPHDRRRQRSVRAAALALGAAGLVTVVARAQTDTELRVEDGLRLQRKIASIVSNGSTGRGGGPPVTIHEREVNAYLQFQGAAALPVGVDDAVVALEDRGRLAVSATVDLGAVSAAEPRSALDPLRYLTGSVPVSARGVLHGAEGRGHLEVEEAVVGGISVPVTVLRELVAYYSRSEEHPDGFDVTQPFDLPYSIRQVAIRQGRAVVVQ